jgi:ABC-type antimicrobial peptide transport system permease subunit
MKFLDILFLALNNLRRTKIRTFLTTLGVMIGIAALSSLVSFGTGLERKVTEVFNANDLFTSLTITSSPIRFGNPDEEIRDTVRKKRTPLNDSIISVVRKFPEVEIIFPEVNIASRVKLGNDSSTATITGMPADMAHYKPYDQLMGGKFFSSDSDQTVIVTTSLLRRMNLMVRDSSNSDIKIDTSNARYKKRRFVPIDSVLGKRISIFVAVAGFNPMAAFGLPVPAAGIQQRKYEFIIGGVIKQEGFSTRGLPTDIIMPIARAQKIPSVGFTNVFELLSRAGGEKSKYSSVYLRVKDMSQAEAVKQRLEKMNLNVLSFSDQLKEIKQGFYIVQSVLAVVGIISLLVAGLGIINTMLMSILERTREIGIMKAIGGSELQVRSIFFVEAGTIGFFGALGGLGIGWLMTRVADFIVNAKITSSGNDPVNLFYFPSWLIIGAILFSIIISLLAGLYPAVRASRIDPVEALRHN